jgi:ParB family chromosome partitioning protein
MGGTNVKADKKIKEVTKIVSGENIMQIPLAELYEPEAHPFQVNGGEAMERLVRSVKQYGVREPGLARPRSGGGYELLCGNRRKRACELAGIPTLPVIVREMDDDSAVIAMVDSNLEQREKILPSEKAWAYRMKLEALNHSGVKGNILSVDILVEQTGESKNQIYRLVRLTELIYSLIDKVDGNQLAFNPAVELSYLSQKEQTAVASAMEKHGIKPSLSQAVRLKKLKQADKLTIEMIDKILAENKKLPKPNKEFRRFSGFFPAGFTARQMNQIITNLLREWQTKN